MSQCAYSLDALNWTDLPVGPQFDLSLGIDEQNTELATDGGVIWLERLFERESWVLRFRLRSEHVADFRALHDAVDGQMDRLFFTLDRTADPIIAVYGWKEAGFAISGTGEPVQPPVYNYQFSLAGEKMSILALLRSYAFDDLPADPAAGTLARITDAPGGLWMYSGIQWVKVSPDINVKDAPYNAAGDGSTDDAAAINAAIQDAFNAGGGRVFFPAGTYVAGATIVLRSNVSIVGSGMETTIFFLKSGANCPVMATATDQATYLDTGNISVGESCVNLSNFTIDGNRAAQSSGYGISAYWYKCALDHLIVRNCKQAGIVEGWGSFGTPPPFEDMTNTYHDVTVSSCDASAHQWYHSGPHDSKFSACIVCQGIGVSNLHVGPYGSGAMFTNCHSWSELGVRQPSWSVIFEATNCMWNNSTAEGGSIGQILIRANSCLIEGGSQYCVDPAADQIGIQIGDTANGFTNITGHNIRTNTVNFSVATVAFDADGGDSRVEILGYNSKVGSVLYTGTPASDGIIDIYVTGNGGSLSQRPYSSVFGVGPAFSFGGADYALNAVGDSIRQSAGFASFFNSSFGGQIGILKSRAASPGGNAIVQADDVVGEFVFFADDGVDYESPAAAIVVNVDGTPGAGDMPGRVSIWTTQDGSETLTERLRVDSKGNIRAAMGTLATNATDGFLYVPACAGTPTGTPTDYSGWCPIVVDSTNHKLYFYAGGAWRDAGP